jgi:hypothetical protein
MNLLLGSEPIASEDAKEKVKFNCSVCSMNPTGSRKRIFSPRKLRLCRLSRRVTWGWIAA